MAQCTHEKLTTEIQRPSSIQRTNFVVFRCEICRTIVAVQPLVDHADGVSKIGFQISAIQKSLQQIAQKLK